jgi:protein-S-isoprenylcysteine O-methyltransferase Ste14
MYVAVVAAILGQAAWFVSGWRSCYAPWPYLVMATFVIAYEEPTLRDQFGDGLRGVLPRRPAMDPAQDRSAQPGERR